MLLLTFYNTPQNEIAQEIECLSEDGIVREVLRRFGTLETYLDDRSDVWDVVDADDLSIPYERMVQMTDRIRRAFELECSEKRRAA